MFTCCSSTMAHLIVDISYDVSISSGDHVGELSPSVKSDTNGWWTWPSWRMQARNQGAFGLTSVVDDDAVTSFGHICSPGGTGSCNHLVGMCCYWRHWQGSLVSRFGGCERTIFGFVSRPTSTRHELWARSARISDIWGTMWSGNNNQCLDVMDCQGASIGGNRCLPNSCFQKTLMSKDNFDLANYNETLFQEAGYSEAEIMAALAESKSERAFLQMSQFLALSSELHSNATTQCPFGIEQKPALIHAKMKMSRFPTLDCTLKYSTYCCDHYFLPYNA